MKYVIAKKQNGRINYVKRFGSGRTKFQWCNIWTMGEPMYFDQPDPSIVLPKGVWWDALDEEDYQKHRRREMAK